MPNGKELSENNLQNLTKEELINKIISLETHVEQLKNVIKKNINSEKGLLQKEKPHPKKARNFNFSKYKVRHVALKLLYLGWNYQGYVVQEDTNKTIEAALFDALLKTKLIQSRETSNYHRCGRTDKGVSAFSQVISIDLRTNLTEGKGVITPDHYQKSDINSNKNETLDKNEEIQYATILNKVLPPEIRVIAWAPVHEKFSARFDCVKRTYKYLFPIGNLNIDKMKDACQYLIGEHDFRNLCKMDVNNGVVNYKRKIFVAEFKYNVDNSDDKHDKHNDNEDGYPMCELLIIGQAFLWHQIRCIVAILFLIGEGKEQPTIIKDLLDIEKCPYKPQYCMAAEFPLVLFDCQYNDCDISEWIFEKDAIIDLIKHLQTLWCQEAVKATIIKQMLNSLQCFYQQNCDFSNNNNSNNTNDKCPLLFNINHQSNTLSTGVKSKVYKPLFDRPFCESLEEKILKKRKKDNNN